MRDPYDVLGIETGAAPSEVKRAYLRRKELYSQDCLATYTLLTGTERQERLEQVEAAYQNILDLLQPAGDPERDAAPKAQLSAASPDPEQATGAYLRWAREQAGLTVRQLADRTKISSLKLEDIEAERFAYLPPTVYLRGFVREIARCLGIADPSRLSEFYLKRVPEESDS